jgi:hypothetical protein
MYYYLAAQLPHLEYGQAAPMSSRAFIELCRGHLSARDAAGLPHCTLGLPPQTDGEKGAPCGTAAPSELSDFDVAATRGLNRGVAKTRSKFTTKWIAWESALRFNLAKYRAQKLTPELKREGGSELPCLPTGAVSAAKAACAFESPLEAELFLDKARWDAIESLAGLNAFSETAIYAYLLKLLLMERRAAFTVEEGFTEYKGLYAAVLSGARNTSPPGETR